MTRGVAQLAARLVWDQEVPGSNPGAPSHRVARSPGPPFAPVAQWIEHLPSKQVVAGSIPAGRRNLPATLQAGIRPMCGGCHFYRAISSMVEHSPLKR